MTAPIKVIGLEAAFAGSASEDVAPGDFLREFLRVTWGRKGLITTILGVALLLACAAIIIIPPRYTAAAMIEISFRADRGEADAKSELAASLDPAALVNSAAQIIGSRANAGAVVTQLQLDKDPAFTRQPLVRSLISSMRARFGLDGGRAPRSLSPHELAVNTLMRHVAVTSEARSYVISIAGTWDDPVTAARLANTMALEYLRTRAMQQIADARSAGTRELADLLSAYGVRHPNYTRSLAKLDDLTSRMAALSKGLTIEEVGALGVGQFLIPADKVLIPSSPDPKLFVGLIVGAALIGSMLLAWRLHGHQAEASHSHQADASNSHQAEASHGHRAEASHNHQAEASPALLERYQHSERALVTTLAEMYVQLGPRKAKASSDDASGQSFSASAISAINTQQDESLAAFARRPLQNRFAYLILDARSEKLREAGTVVSKKVLIAAGIDWDGRSHMLGVEMAAESGSVWREFLHDLKTRGLRGVKLVVSADHDGLVAAVAEVLPQASWQRCCTRFLKDASGYLPRTHTDGPLQDLRWIYERGEISKARADLAEWLGKWTRRYPRLAAWVDKNVEQTLTFFTLPKQHRKHVSSTGLLEQLNEEIRIRTDLVRVFPNAESCMRVIRALALETHEDWITATSCLNMDELREYKKTPAKEAA